MPRQINDKCINCEYCIPQCPVVCIYTDQTKMKVLIDAKVCIDCGACQQVCPVNAIDEITINLKKEKSK